ncbi:MAG: signal peptidase I [Chloroflexi bacterium]|nr:signal peptidase I [Chloroflexota bacterium]
MISSTQPQRIHSSISVVAAAGRRPSNAPALGLVAQPGALSSARIGRWPGTALQAAQVCLIILGLALVGLVVFPPAFGLRSFLVAGASMEPAVPRGSVIFVRPVPPSSLRVGDVITFAVAEQPGVLVTHRVVAIELTPNGLGLRTRGDGNNTDDVWTVQGDEAAGRMVGFLPFAGFALAAAGTTPVRVALVGLILVVLTHYVVKNAPERA